MSETRSRTRAGARRAVPQDALQGVGMIVAVAGSYAAFAVVVCAIVALVT